MLKLPSRYAIAMSRTPSLRLRAVVGRLIAVAALLAACTPGPTPTAPVAASPSQAGGVLPTIISSELVVGPNRVLFSFLDSSGSRPVGAPERQASVTFEGPGGEAVTTPEATFIWAIEGTSGLYVTEADFPTAGDWTATFTTSAPDSPEQTVPFGFQVKDDASVVRPGEPAPSVETPTLADVDGDVARVSSDTEPVEAFYETSVADALAADEPFVLVFATPAFCQSQVCGPTLEKVKEVAADQPDVTFINVEPYQTEFADGQLRPVLSADNLLQTVPASDAYGLITEPYVFVVGSDGIVAASFELIFTPEEMNAAIAGLGA